MWQRQQSIESFIVGNELLVKSWDSYMLMKLDKDYANKKLIIFNDYKCKLC